MRILMLGWEYPPDISGGLGTACEGIVSALAAAGREITFAAPHADEALRRPRVRFVDLSAVRKASSASDGAADRANRVRKIKVKSALRPYMTEEDYFEMMERAAALSVEEGLRSVLAFSEEYGTGLAEEVKRYARALESLAVSEAFDIIHAHDWMTFPAAVRLKELTGVPLVLHIHSLETDRNRENPDPDIIAIEKNAIYEADHVIAVSFITKNCLLQKYDAPEWKLTVVHNAVSRRDPSWTGSTMKQVDRKIVLFLGRVTSQKGPEYFIDAAARVLEVDGSVWFVMAGSGDMLPKMIERAAALRIGGNFHFTGFLDGRDVERMYAMSDVYVMPSASEPFGISSLEAMLYDVPVIMTKETGAREVVRHALQVDPWNVDQLANGILAVLRYPALQKIMIRLCTGEIANVCWEHSAEKINDVYATVLEGNN